MDRFTDFIGFFGDLGMGVDLFCYTEEEIRTVPLAGKACSGARWLFQRDAD
jgi:hypothetical protein